MSASTAAEWEVRRQNLVTLGGNGANETFWASIQGNKVNKQMG